MNEPNWTERYNNFIEKVDEFFQVKLNELTIFRACVIIEEVSSLILCTNDEILLTRLGMGSSPGKGDFTLFRLEYFRRRIANELYNNIVLHLKLKNIFPEEKYEFKMEMKEKSGHFLLNCGDPEHFTVITIRNKENHRKLNIKINIDDIHELLSANSMIRLINKYKDDFTEIPVFSISYLFPDCSGNYSSFNANFLPKLKDRLDNSVLEENNAYVEKDEKISELIKKLKELYPEYVVEGDKPSDRYYTTDINIRKTTAGVVLVKYRVKKIPLKNLNGEEFSTYIMGVSMIWKNMRYSTLKIGVNPETDISLIRHGLEEYLRSS